MNGLSRTLANTSTQIAKMDHHPSRHLTYSQEPVQNTILPDKNHRLDKWSQLGEYQHLLLWNSLFLRWEITSDHRLEHLTGFLERTLLLQTGGRRRGLTAPRSQDLDGFFEPCARTERCPFSCFRHFFDFSCHNHSNPLTMYVAPALRWSQVELWCAFAAFFDVPLRSWSEA